MTDDKRNNYYLSLYKIIALCMSLTNDLYAPGTIIGHIAFTVSVCMYVAWVWFNRIVRWLLDDILKKIAKNLKKLYFHGTNY